MHQAGQHWTERSIKDYIYRLGFDFVQQIDELLRQKVITRAELATNLGVSKGRVSQVLNDPGNIGLESIVRYARGVKRKVSLVLYDDNDPENLKGPINSEIFSKCWEERGKPADFFALSGRPINIRGMGLTPIRQDKFRIVPAQDNPIVNETPTRKGPNMSNTYLATPRGGKIYG